MLSGSHMSIVKPKIEQQRRLFVCKIWPSWSHPKREYLLTAANFIFFMHPRLFLFNTIHRHLWHDVKTVVEDHFSWLLILNWFCTFKLLHSSSFCLLTLCIRSESEQSFQRRLREKKVIVLTAACCHTQSRKIMQAHYSEPGGWWRCEHIVVCRVCFIRSVCFGVRKRGWMMCVGWCISCILLFVLYYPANICAN